MRDGMCEHVRGRISDYLDNACSPESLRGILSHLGACQACREEFARAESVSQALRSAPRLRVSPDLALRLRVLLSQEVHRNAWGRLWVHFQNAFQPLWLPASGGIVSALICLGLLMGQGVPPAAHTPDVPTDISTPATLQDLNPVSFNVGAKPVIVLTTVDAQGQATGYKILSGQHSPQLTRQLDRMIYFSLFHPATMFGRPTSGKVVLMVRRITVRG